MMEIIEHPFLSDSPVNDYLVICDFRMSVTRFPVASELSRALKTHKLDVSSS